MNIAASLAVGTTTPVPDIRSSAFYADPYPTYRQMRDEHRVWHDEASDLWFMSRHEDISRALSEPETFSSSGGNAIVDSPLRVGRTLGSMDPPRHDELRSVMVRGFTPRRIAATLPTFVQDVEERLAAVAERRSCDLVGDVTRPVLLAALGRMLGLDAEAARTGAQLQAGLFHHTGGPLGSALAPEDMAKVFDLLGAQLERRRRAPEDDLFSTLLAAQAAGAPMSDEEIVANMTTVLLAGAASLGHFAPNVVHALWANPDARAKVAQDSGKIDAAIEEAVRWDTSTQAFARVLKTDVDIGETCIPSGSRVALLYGSANRDERAIPDPDRYDLDRPRGRHFGFGGGPHHCLGAPAARQFCRAFLAAFLPRVGDFELDVYAAVRVEHIMVRGFKSLPVSW